MDGVRCGAATHDGGLIYCEQLTSVDRHRWVGLDDEIGYDLRTNGTGAGAMLFVPTAVGSDRAGRQGTRVVGIVGNQLVDHPAARPGPLLAPALHAGVGKAEPLLRCPTLVSQLHEELVHLHPLGQKPDGTILLDDTQQDGIFRAPRTRAERRARIRGLCGRHGLLDALDENLARFEPGNETVKNRTDSDGAIHDEIAFEISPGQLANDELLDAGLDAGGCFFRELDAFELDFEFGHNVVSWGLGLFGVTEGKLNSDQHEAPSLQLASQKINFLQARMSELDRMVDTGGVTDISPPEAGANHRTWIDNATSPVGTMQSRRVISAAPTGACALFRGKPVVRTRLRRANVRCPSGTNFYLANSRRSGSILK